MVLLWLMYDFSTYSPEADGTDSTFSIPPSKENGYPVVTNKQKAPKLYSSDLFNRFTVKSPEIRVMSPDILSHVARSKQRYLRLCLTSHLHRLPGIVESTLLNIVELNSLGYTSDVTFLQVYTLDKILGDMT